MRLIDFLMIATGRIRMLRCVAGEWGRGNGFGMRDGVSCAIQVCRRRAASWFLNCIGTSV